MKWSIVGLFAMGIVAAVAAAVLVASLQTSVHAESNAGPALADGEFEVRPILVAARDLAPMSIVTAESVRVRQVDRRSAPQGSFSDPVQVVGKVLRAQLTEGQAFTDAYLAREGSAIHLVSAMRPGMRAVSISLHDDMGLENLLYPGSVCDVLASLDVRRGEGEPVQPTSVTLLQRVIVLAVGNRTFVSPEQDTEGEGLLGNGRPTVTLLVDPHEAEVLKLAMHTGDVSLTLRNPMDESSIESDGAWLEQLSPTLSRLAANARDKERFSIEKARQELLIAQQQLERDRLDAERERSEAQRELDRETTGAPVWQTTVLRGPKSELRTFQLEDGEVPDTEEGQR